MMRRLILSTLFLVAATPAFAHVGQHLGFSAASGFAHPLMGLDHLAAMIAVGLWAAMAGGKRIWIWPAAFVMAMLVGGFIGRAGIELPQVEPVIALSVVVLGVLVATGVSAPVPLGAMLLPPLQSSMAMRMARRRLLRAGRATRSALPPRLPFFISPALASAWACNGRSEGCPSVRSAPRPPRSACSS